MSSNKRNIRGFTLIEVIIAIALIGIISAGLIPAFAAQFKMTVDTKNITTESFDAQGGFETIINELKNALADPLIDEMSIDDVTKESKTLFGRDVEMHKLLKLFPDNSNKDFLVFLSKKLAEMEIRQLLVAEDVRIEVINGVSPHEIADMKKTPKPTLKGLSADIEDPGIRDENWYANIYKWYYSDIGNPNPVFPTDYERVIIPGVTPATLDNLSKYSNRYIVFTVTPVDIHGVRGSEVRSSNRVYVLGEEWREGVFAWVDKDEDISYIADTDIIIKKTINPVWHLLDGFDTGKEFLDPTDPNKTLDPKDGSLYVPMSIDRITGQRVGPIDVSGSNAIDWKVDKSINLATDINVSNNSDINMKTRDGNITFYQYLKLNASGKAEYETNGLPKLINYGPNVSTGGDIHLATEGRGNVVLQDYSKLMAGDNIVIDPFGRISMSQTNVVAGDSITLDTTKGNTFPGNRNIMMQDSNLELSVNGITNREIHVKTLNKLELFRTTIKGNTGAASQFITSAKDGAALSEVDFNSIDVMLNNNSTMSGGSWDSGHKVTVADGKKLTFGAGYNKVDNAGSLILGNTGGVDFVNSVESDLVKPLTITLGKGSSDNKLDIGTNYGRNVGYADSQSAQSIAVAGRYQNLGSGQSNLEYTANKTAGGIPNLSSLTYTFDGENTILIEAYASDVIDEETVQLTIRDKYSNNKILNTINFTIMAAGAGEATVTVDKAVIKHTVVFKDYDGSELKSQSVKHGNSAQAPVPPVREGYIFAGWDTDFTQVTSDLTVTAQYTQIAIPHTVTFYKRNSNNTSWVQHATITVNQGETIDALPQNPSGYKSGNNKKIFKSWNTAYNGSGSIVDTDTVVTGNMNVYAVYASPRTLYFYTNYGSGLGTLFAIIEVAEGNSIGALMPNDPVRTNWTFQGWNTERTNQGTFVDSTYIVNWDRNLFARWQEASYSGMSFGDITIGQYIAIGNVKFQKIDSDKIFARDSIRASGNSNWRMSWTSANTLASNYYKSFSSTSWVTGSGLVSSDLLLGSLSYTNGGNQYLLDVLRNENSWWGGRQGTSNNAYRVAGSNDNYRIFTQNMNGNESRCRPYITVNTQNLVVSSGSGTEQSPFILTNQ